MFIMFDNVRKSGRVMAGVVLVAAIFFGGFVLGSAHPTLLALAQDGTPADSKLFAPFWEAWNLLHQNYVDPLDDNKLLQGALAGMMAAPGDKFTNYFDPAFYKSTTEQLAGQFSGIGATVKKDTKSGGLIVISTISGAPARTAGLQDGDLIVQVDGKDITTLAENDIVSKVRGLAGTIVKLGILRGDATTPIVIPVTRGQIVIPDVTTHMYTGQVGYIALTEFGDHATKDFEAGLKALHPDKLKGLILDLRGNPGGYVEAAVSVASAFVDSGVILTEEEHGGHISTFNAKGHPLVAHVPIIVLVDGGTASAAEIVSGALRDYGRAKLLGTQTYGKGSAQIIEQLSDGGAAHITIARWYTPAHHTIQGVGLTPDFIIRWDTKADPDVDVQLRQAILILRGEM